MTSSGFGWTNARSAPLLYCAVRERMLMNRSWYSYNVGLSFLDEQHFRYLHVLADPDELYPFPA